MDVNRLASTPRMEWSASYMDWLTQQDGPTLWIANIGGQRGRPTYMEGPTHMEGRPFRADTMDLMDTWEAQCVYQVADD
jgi:hypothetical protein